MTRLHDVLGYLCRHYPYLRWLSKARLMALAYLADWKSSIEHGCQLTEARWVFGDTGAYSVDVCGVIRGPSFEVREVAGEDGGIRYVGPDSFPSLSPADEAILRQILTTAEEKSWPEFLRLVHSTYPLLRAAQGETLDLPDLARRYAVEVAAMDEPRALAGVP